MGIKKTRKYMKVSSSIVLLILVTLGVSVLATPEDLCDVSYGARMDCTHAATSQEECEGKGCCWGPTTGTVGFLKQNNLKDTPWCFFKSDTPDDCKTFTWTASEPGFDDAFLAKVEKAFLNNIDVQDSGAVVASRDNSTPGGSYFYHWMRDGALTMKVYLDINNQDYDTVKDKFRKYVAWVKNVQSQQDNNVDVRVEAKFEIPSGTPYAGGWCRPQTDGPGLRSNSLSMFAQILVKQGLMDEAKEIFAMVKNDLDWVENKWESSGCDLWEEFTSTDFFWAKSAWVYALENAAVVAGQLGDSKKGDYTALAETIRQNIFAKHFNGTYIFEAHGRDMDGSVLHAVASFGKTIWNPSHENVAKTIQAYNLGFCHEYSINQKDNRAGIPGVLIGRYPGDHYAGGNPWPLLTATYAETFYLGAQEFYQRDQTSLLSSSSDAGVKEWMKLLNMEGSNLTMSSLADAAMQAGDSIMARMWQYVKNDDGRIDEQIDRDTGAQKSAKELTWSHANILHVMHTRKSVMNKFKKTIAKSE